MFGSGFHLGGKNDADAFFSASLHIRSSTGFFSLLLETETNSINPFWLEQKVYVLQNLSQTKCCCCAHTNTPTHPSQFVVCMLLLCVILLYAVLARVTLIMKMIHVKHIMKFRSFFFSSIERNVKIFDCRSLDCRLDLFPMCRTDKLRKINERKRSYNRLAQTQKFQNGYTNWITNSQWKTNEQQKTDAFEKIECRRHCRYWILIHYQIFSVVFIKTICSNRAWKKYNMIKMHLPAAVAAAASATTKNGIKSFVFGIECILKIITVFLALRNDSKIKAKFFNLQRSFKSLDEFYFCFN